MTARQMMAELHRRKFIGTWSQNKQGEFVTQYDGDKVFIEEKEVKAFYNKLTQKG